MDKRSAALESERQCSKCPEVKPIGEFYNSKNGPGGKSVKCKTCHRAQTKAWRKKNPEMAREGYRRYGRKHPEVRQKNAKEYTIKNPLAAKARQDVRHARDAGILIKPERCEECDQKRKLVAHHEDHEKPLEVLWVCYPCHSVVEEMKRRKCA